MIIKDNQRRHYLKDVLISHYFSVWN